MRYFDKVIRQIDVFAMYKIRFTKRFEKYPTIIDSKTIFKMSLNFTNATVKNLI